MPELAEVEHYCRRWQVGLGGCVLRVHVNAAARGRIFKYIQPVLLASALKGTVLCASLTHGKHMLFRFDEDRWLSIHLGMSGTLATAEAGYCPAKYDHVVLYQEQSSLIFNDPRQFGFVKLHQGADPPPWWQQLPLAITSERFTLTYFLQCLATPDRMVIKAALLDQSRFPGIGNWMADEILWRAGVHPASLVRHLPQQVRRQLYCSVCEVVQQALAVIGQPGGGLRRDMLERPPDSWLFNHRWRPGGQCPKTGENLERIKVAGRTSCFSPSRQKYWPC